jgi:flagellar basal body-associated protein FliL
MEEKPFYYDPHGNSDIRQKKPKCSSSFIIVINLVIVLFAAAIITGIVYAGLRFFGTL